MGFAFETPAHRGMMWVFNGISRETGIYVGSLVWEVYAWDIPEPVNNWRRDHYNDDCNLLLKFSL